MKIVRNIRAVIIVLAACVVLYEKFTGHSVRQGKRVERARAVYAERVTDADASRVIDDNVVAYSSANPSISEARQKAKETLPRFLEMLKSGKTGTYSVKFPLRQQGKAEHIWLQVDAYSGGTFKGRLANEPTIATDYHLEQAMTVREAEVEDWMVRTEGGIYGGYVSRYALKDMPEGQRRKIEAQFRD